MDGDHFSVELCSDISQLSQTEWDQLAGADNPFSSHAFLLALEAGKAVGGETGWDPAHLLLRDTESRLVGAMPLYVKHHSYGEYVFDHSWANGFMRAGGQYYPKLLSAVPFTPVTGQRFLTGGVEGQTRDHLVTALAEGLCRYVDQFNLSSTHINFLPEHDLELLAAKGWLIRTGIQFHWQNADYESFDDFLANLSSRKRKNIRKERQSVADAGIRMLTLSSDTIKTAHMDDFYRFYMSTIDRKWGGAYLTRAFFDIVHQTMAEKILLIMAEQDGRIIGGALNFIGTEALYGRNWGADVDVPNLHFEACYYQAIDYAISHGMTRVEAGAQGFHKVQRGYMPVKTHSAHWIAHPGFRDAVARFLTAEERGVEAEANQISMAATPFKRG